MRKITFILAAFICSMCVYSQTQITSIGIAGRAVKGMNNFNNVEALVDMGNGEFVWYGYLYNNQPGSSGSGSGKGFKFGVNTTSGTDGTQRLTAASDGLSVTAGGPYTATYTGSDNKWRLAEDHDDYYKVIIRNAIYTNSTSIEMYLEKALGSFADLASLSVPGGELTPAFDPAVDTYSCVVKSISVTPIAVAYINAPVSGVAPVDLSSGSGTSTLVVTSLDGNTTKPYTINYTVSQEDNADLKSLSLSSGSFFYFSPEVTDYTIRFPRKTESVEIIAVPVVDEATVIGVGNATVSYPSGTLTIEVTATDGSTKEAYTINYTVADDWDYTDFIVNNDFDYVTSTVAFTDTDNYPTFSDGSTSNISAWRPLKQNTTKIDDHLYFYGWELSDWEFLFKDGSDNFINPDETSPNQSIGINPGVSSTHGTGAWINGHYKCVMPDDFEFYQVIDHSNLEAGTYKLSCLMGIQSLTSQRLFANNQVQFYGKETDYEQNKIENEIYSYAGYAVSSSGDTHNEMNVYVTISGDESLKIGIRSGNKNGNGDAGSATGGNLRGWFKMDYFRLTKIDDADFMDATLNSITLKSGNLNFSSSGESLINFSAETTTYNVALPYGTTTVTPAATANIEGAVITGTNAVDVSDGSGTSVIVVTALDEINTETYTINYAVVDVKPEINTIGIAGRATGYNEFNTMQMFTEVADGEFAWMGHLQNKLTESGNQGFKCQVNSTIMNDWLNIGCLSLKAITTDDEVSDGGTYSVDYSQQTGSNDKKWRLIENGDGYYKITYYTVDIDNVTMRLDKVDGNFANLISLSVEGLELTPAFNPEQITYSCVFPSGTISLTPTVAAYGNTPVSGAEAVDVSIGTGISTITVTSLDAITTKTYTINYTVDSTTGLNEINTQVTHFVADQKLTVTGADAYAVYALNGVKIADVKNNISGTAISLEKGAYIVKTNNAQTFKVLIK